MSGIKRSLLLQHDADHVEEFIGGAANGSAVRVASLAQGGVAKADFGIVLNGYTCPVVDGIVQPNVRRPDSADPQHQAKAG